MAASGHSSCSETEPRTRGAAENLDERFGAPGGPDPGEATSSGPSASFMRERAAQSLNPEMGRMGAEDPSAAFRLRLQPQAAYRFRSVSRRGGMADAPALGACARKGVEVQILSPTP